MRGRRGTTVLLPILSSTLALIAGLFINAVPAAANEQSSSETSEQGPVVAPPASARAVATRAGTEVFIAPALMDSVAADLPSLGYQVVSCGPFALDSVQFNVAMGDSCAGDDTVQTVDVPAGRLTATVECVPTAASWCLVIVRGRNAERFSEPVLAASGGVGPNAPTSINATREGGAVRLAWAPGPDVKQIGSLPSLAIGYEVRRDGRLLRAYVDGTAFTDTCSATCTYSVRAVTAAGRSRPSVVALAEGLDEATGGPVDDVAPLSGVAETVGPRVTVSGSGTPSGRGASLSIDGTWKDHDGGAIEIPVNSAGGWSFTFLGSGRGAGTVTVAQTVNGAVTRVPISYTVSSLRGRLAAAVKPPGVPTKVVAVANATAVAVSWKAPASNGAAITKYVVTSTPGAKSCTYTVPKTGAALNTCTVPGLTYGTTYTFAVKAYNSAGASAAGVSATVTPKAAPTAPAKPTLVAAAGGVAVSWVAPSANGAPITSYKATATPGNASCTYVVPARGASANTCTITGLTAGASYTVKVAAKNAVDWSALSPASNAVTVPNRPGAPTAVVAQSKDGAATVSWIAPTSTGGAAIRSYRVQVVGDPSKTCTYAVPSSGTPANECTVTGLVNTTRYQFTVTATNIAGESTASAASSAIAVGAPDAPAYVTAEAANGSARVTIPNVDTLPSGMSSPSWVVTVKDHPEIWGCTAYREFVYVPSFGVAPTTSCSVSGLTNGVEYTFIVRIRVAFAPFLPDSEAFSAPSESNPVTPSAPPSPPQNVTVYSYNGGALLSWEAPSSNGGSPITAYRVTATPADGEPITYAYGAAARRVGISGLENGVRYSVSVTAVTQRGTGTAIASSAALYTATASAPREVVAEGGDREATVSWTAPATIPFPILSYRIVATDYFYPERQVVIDAPSSPATVPGLVNGHTYTFTVIATNDAGSSPASSASAQTLVATLPDAPESAYVEGGNRYITVTWAPVDFTRSGGSSVTDYVITATPTSGIPISITVPGAYTGDWSSLWASITASDGLVDGVDYQITVAARSGAGVSIATDAGTARSIGAPSQASITSVEEGNGRLRVTWTPPASDGGSTVTRYDVTAWGGSCSVWFPSGDGPFTCTISGLTNGYTVAVNVTAYNNAGSSYSATSFATPRQSAPDSPVDVSATASQVSSGVADVSWAPLGDDGGQPVTSYTVSASADGRGCVVYTSAATSCRVYGLTPGKQYTFTVVATSSLGSSAPSSASNAITAVGRPGQPGAPIVRGGPTTANVSFDGAAANGSPIDSYEVTIVDLDPQVTNPPAVTGMQSPIEVSGLILGHSYRFFVTARNALGEGYGSVWSDTWISANRPSAPNITGVDPGIESVYVSFTTPADGGSPITSYELVAYDQSASVPDTISRVTSSPAQITGLITGHAYRVTVRATNVAGDSPSSVASDLIAPQLQPGEPGDVAATSQNHGLSIAFTPPSDDGGSAVTGYRVKVHDSVTGTDVFVSGSNSPIVVGGLVNGRTYSVSVQAAKGEYILGPFDDAAAVGVPAGVPDAPSSVVAASAQDGLSTVTFDAPSDNGAAITSYTVTAVDQAAPFDVITATGDSSPIVITGLTNRHDYRVTVAATNRMGTGEAAPNIGYVRPLGRPSAPTIGAVSATGPTSAVVAFTAPTDDGGGSITSYTVTAIDNDDLTGTRTSTGAGSPITMTGLVSGDTYTFVVTATNVSGTGPDSAAVPAAPQGVSGLSATPGDGQVEIEWVVPEAILGEPAIYTATTGTGQTCSSAGTSCVIPGLTNYTSYSVTVSAANAGGVSGASTAINVTPIPVSVATTVPSAPRNVAVMPGITGLGDGTLAVTWDPPVDAGGGAITGYVVTTSPADGSCATQYSRSCLLTGLDPYALYTVRVIATNAVGNSIAGVSSEVSACGGAARQAKCKWSVGGQEVRAEQVDGGIRVSWTFNLGRVATASPSGRTCTSRAYDPVTFQVAPTDSQGRQYCVIPGAFDPAESFRVAASDYDTSASVHAELVSLAVPRYTRALTPHVTGSVTSRTTVTLVVAPSSCADVLDCAAAESYTGTVADGTFDIPLPSIDEGSYLVYLVNPLLENTLALTTPQPMVVDRQAPTPLTVPVAQTTVSTDGVDVVTPGVAYHRAAIVYGSAECDALNTFTATWYSGREAAGIPIATHTPERLPMGANCWYSDSVPGAADGDYLVVVHMADPSGNESEISQIVVVDSVAPDLSMAIPLSGESVPAGIVAISGASITAPADLTGLTVTATSGSTTITRAVTIGADGAWETQLPLGVGAWTVSASRRDRSANAATVNRSITVLAAATSVSMSQPSNGETVNSSTTVTGWAIPGSIVSLTSSGVDLATTTATIDGSWSATVSLSADATEITASVGPAATSTAVSVGLTQIGLAIANPGVGGRTNGRALTGTAPPEASPITVSVDGDAHAVPVDASGQWSFSLAAYAAGSHSVTATIPMSSITMNIVIDRSAPLMEITTPTTGSVRSDSVHLSVPSSVADSSTVQLSYFEGTDTTGSADFTDTVDISGASTATAFPSGMPEGEWTLVATRADAGGNIARDEVTFTYDTSAPLVSSNIRAEMTGPLTISGTTGRATGDLPLQIWVDGILWTPEAAGEFSYTPTPQITSGVHDLTVRQVDAAGNVSVTETTVTVDSVPPTLTMALDGAGATYAGLVVSGSATGDDGQVDVTATPCSVAASPCAADATTFATSVDPEAGLYSADLDLPGGYWYVTTSRVDRAGNSTSRGALVLVDFEAASIEIASPSAVVATSTLTIEGTTDADPWRPQAVQISVTRTGASSAAFAATVELTDAEFSISTPVLADGDYDVTVTRDDPVHQAVSTQRVTIDTTGPAIAFDALPEHDVQKWCGTAGTATRDLGSVTLDFNLGEASYRTTAVPALGGRFCFDPYGSGDWQVSATQLDSLGNETTTPVSTVRIDKVAPAVVATKTNPDLLLYIPWRPFLLGTAGIETQDSATVTVSLHRRNCFSGACDTTVTGAVAADGTWKAGLGGLAEDWWQVVSVSQADEAGNAGTFTVPVADRNLYTFRVDHNLPALPSISVASGWQVTYGVLAPGTLQLRACPSTFFIPFTLTVKLFRGGGALPYRTTSTALDHNTWCAPNGVIMQRNVLTGAEPVPNGNYTVVAEVSDPLGNVARTDPFPYVSNWVLPRVTISGISSGDDPTPTASGEFGKTLTVSGTGSYNDFDPRTITVTFDALSGDQSYRDSLSSSTYIATKTLSADGTWTVDVPAGLPVGAYRVSATQGAARATSTFTITMTAPVVEAATVTGERLPGTNSPASTQTITVTGTAPASPAAAKRLAGVDVVMTSAPAGVGSGAPRSCTPVVTDGRWRCTLIGYYPNGAYQFTAYDRLNVGYTRCTAIDNAGACTMVAATGVQRVSASASFTLNGEVPYPTVDFASTPVAGTRVFGTTTVSLRGTATLRTGDVRSVTINLYRRDDIADWPAITEAPYATYTVTPNATTGVWTKDVTADAGTWAVQVTQAGAGGMVGVSAPAEFLIDTVPPVITVTYPTARQAVPTGQVMGTMTGGIGVDRGNDDTSDRTYATDGTVTFYSGWDRTTFPAASAIAISTNPDRTWEDRDNTSFSLARSLAAGRWTAVFEAYDENGRYARRVLEFEVRPSLLPAVPILSARLEGTTPITGTVPTSVGYRRITVRADERWGNGVSQAPTGNVTLVVGDYSATQPLVDRESTFRVPLVRGTAPVKIGIQSSADNSFVAASGNVVGSLQVAGQSTQNLAAAFAYPGGAAAPGVATVSAFYVGLDSTGTVATLPCSTSVATVRDASGRTLGSGSLAHGGRFTIAKLIGGSQNLTVSLADGPHCNATSGSFGAQATETATPQVTASVSDASIPHVGGDTVINARLAPSVDSPLAVAVPVHVENAAGEVVSTSTVVTNASGEATLHVVPTASGSNVFTVVAGGGTSGFARTTTQVTIVAEPSPVNLVLTVDSAGTRAGEAGTATLVLGASGLSGTVEFSAGTPRVGGATVNAVITCAADCRATGAFPSDVLDSGLNGTIKATYTSASTGRTYTTTVSTGRVAWTTSMSNVVAGAGPPISFSAASGGSGTVNLAWIAPPTIGSSTISGYRVTAVVDGVEVGQCTTATTSCSIAGLPNDTPVTFNAVTRTSAGDSGIVTTTAAASTALTATPTPIRPETLMANAVLRDRLAPVSTTITFPSAMAARFRTGTVTFRAVQAPIFCRAINARCSPTTHEVTVDLATGATTDSLVVTNVSRGSIPAASLAAAGLTVDMLTPTASVAEVAVAGGVGIKVSTQVFVGAYTMLLSASYTPADTAIVTGAATRTDGDVEGTGAPVLRLAIASANITGGAYAPVRYASRAANPQRTLSTSGWGVRDPRVGETAFLKATIDPVFGVFSDRYEHLALAVSQPGAEPLYVSPGDWDPTDRLYEAGALGTVIDTTIDYASTAHGSRPATWRQALSGTSLTCDTDCMVWAIRSVDSTEAAPSGGGLSVGTHEIGVIASGYTGDSITTTTLNVQPWETTQMSQAALTSEAPGQRIRIMTAARWTGMAPEVQAPMSSVMLSVQLTHAGTSRIIAICFYTAVCLSTDGNGTTFLPTEVTSIGARMALEIDPSSLGYTLTSADSIVVTTSTPWGIPAVSPEMALLPTSVAVGTSGAASLTTSGQWLGGVLQEPETHSVWWWAANDALAWFRSAQHSLWMSIFNSEAVASFLMTVTSVALSLIPGYDLITAIACSSWACVAGAVASTFAGVAFAGVKAGFAAFKAARGAATVSAAAAKAPGRVARFVSAVKSRATVAAQRITSSVPGQLAQGFARATSDRLATTNKAYLALGKFSAQVAVAEVRIAVIPAATSFNAIKASYASTPVPVASRVEASDAGFRSNPDYTVYVGDRMVAIDASADGQKAAAWDRAIQDAYAAVAAENPPQPNDVGYGVGVAMQFAHQFASQVSIALPNYSSIDVDRSSVQAILMYNSYDAAYDDSGKPAPAWYRQQYGSSVWLESGGVGTMGTCSLSGTCTTLDGITATVYRGSVEFKGVFPQSISWIPRGAWIKYLVTVVNRTTGAVTKYRVGSNIAFPGRVATDVETGEDGAVTMAHVRPTGKDPGGDYLPWPTGNEDPATTYSKDTAVLTGAL